jgi:intein/homing endonuclease
MSPYYEIDDSVMQVRGYKEFKLDKIDENNLNDIENSLNNGKISSNNKRDLLIYLNGLFRKIAEIKKREYVHEGDDNENVNEYLERISILKSRVEQIK